MNAEPWVAAIDVAQYRGVVKNTVYRWREHARTPQQMIENVTVLGHIVADALARLNTLMATPEVPE